MNQRQSLSFMVCLVVILWAGAVVPTLADEDGPVVRAILFHHPDCPHCHEVIEEVLPPLVERYGEQLQIGDADTHTEEGGALYQAAVEQLQISSERRGVPALIVGDVVLVGSIEIPEQLPGLIERGLAAGGVDWSMDLTPSLVLTVAPRTLAERIAGDMPGNALSIGVLCGMILSVGYVAVDGVRIRRDWKALNEYQRRSLRRPKREKSRGRRHSKVAPTNTLTRREWAVLALCLLGLGVAGYLAYVEITPAEPVCGPIGDCVAVHQSKYARLFGLVPIAVLGVVGYVSILAVWIWKRLGCWRAADLAPVAFLGLTLFGVMFSIYLTFLEPFVVGVTCAWCLTSAVSMTLLLLLVARPGWEALRR
jgi:uncharacterized membrane protein